MKHFTLVLVITRPEGEFSLSADGEFCEYHNTIQFRATLLSIPSSKKALAKALHIKSNHPFQVAHGREILATVHASIQVLSDYGKEVH